MDTLEKAFQLINSTFSREEIIFFGEINEKIIIAAEKELGIVFPNSYRYFLKKVGLGGVNGFMSIGLRTNNLKNIKNTGIVYSVLLDRQDFNQPHHIICISDIGDGSYYALDLSQMNEHGECPVVVWPIGGYEMTPKLEIVAPDFGTFFLHMVKQQIEYKKEEKN